MQATLKCGEYTKDSLHWHTNAVDCIEYRLEHNSRKMSTSSQQNSSGVHKALWVIALCAGLCAVLVAFNRAKDDPSASVIATEEKIQIAMDLLYEDPALSFSDTRTAVRHVAVLTENGLYDSAEAFYILALQYQQEQNLIQAEALFKRSLAKAPDWAEPHCGFGTLIGLNTIGREAEAEEELRKAISLDPNWARPHDSLARLLRILERLEEAEKHARIATELDPFAIGPANNLANLLVKLNRYHDAEMQYLDTIALDPGHPKPYYNLACLYSLLGRKDEAMTYLKLALKRASILRNDAAIDEDLEPLYDNPEFRRLVFGE